MKRCAFTIFLVAFLAGFFPATTLRAETGAEAWLRYARLDEKTAERYNSLPATVITLGDPNSVPMRSAQSELLRGIHGMLGRMLRIEPNFPQEPSIILGTLSDVQKIVPHLNPSTTLVSDGFWMIRTRVHRQNCLIITAPNERGVLYGAFAFTRKISLGEPVANLDEVQNPSAPIRWVDQWDNLDGSIERGYAGRSIFFDNGKILAGNPRIVQYARILASVGINGCTINNVNADPHLLDDESLPQLATIAGAFNLWGVQLSISVDLSSPKTVGGLDTFDPLDPKVAEWWQKKADQIYKMIPNFGGFVVKADSEGRLGPSVYGRTPADAANVIARALKSHHGVVFYRAFVYNHHLDWRDPKNDRAKAAYDNFHPLDGKFEDNVIIQIKHGPIDFQAREPVSPLLGALQNTNEAIELQVTQEYTGQQRHLCFLIPMWKEVLDFDLHSNGTSSPVKDLISGKTFHRPTGGFVAVVNAGSDENWLGHPLAMANLYGYARLAWNPNLAASEVAREWTVLTFGRDPKVVQATLKMLLTSWITYESYTGPLGTQTLTDILGSHYGPGIESSEENGWGQWHRADGEGVGMDRTVATGTGYVGQYSEPVAKIYESLSTTPDELLVFFHHVPYTHVLHSGKTVIQYIYDSHYEGAARAAGYVKIWQMLKGDIDDERYNAVLARLEYQAGHAIVWRDAICQYFFRLSSIPDKEGRVGHYPGRTEAESMQLSGYTVVDVTPRENASGGKAVECLSPQGCSAKFKFEGISNMYRIDVQYFDVKNGNAKYRVFVGDKLVDEWIANLQLPAMKIGGDSSARHRTREMQINHGDEIHIEGIPDRDDHAGLDYVQISREIRR
ncbi:MAG TPA: alpha-glucuronidase family glycosyl hydrolase [Candidatus Dormibacteraeota bacterium]|nr:alpha-glucuronidase family glycosyl hydrolase [Candidatus Dormibacteraeota bacterium]